MNASSIEHLSATLAKYGRGLGVGPCASGYQENGRLVGVVVLVEA
jgi:hypothetical protein